ncbi:MAG: TetR/AcrR family transcriptional regulator C-terminal domain-containing protein [Actinobacteria bacterium]|nr:TetR/AcrR family transcriptional regulator C-terminal domain-containing protein [Actinomycetota bacterium]
MDSAPPYARIAAELQGQIERGELAPGQRVPSTREITARWGVAMATATKVLATLRREGLVRPVPGVGTVVSGTVVSGGAAPPRAPAAGGRLAATATRLPAPGTCAPGPARPPADRGPGDAERIVAAAITVADTEGLAALSMRRVAAELGAAPMSLYRHVADKDDLVLQMMNTVFSRFRRPEPPDGWRAGLELAGRTLWAMFRAHPWLASAMSLTRPQVLPAALPYTEWVLTALHGHGLDPDTVFDMYLTLINFVRGTAVNLETEAEAEAASGLDNEEFMASQEPQFRELVPPGAFPMFERMISDPYDFSLDRIFEFGLQRLLDGLATLITEPG